MNKSLFLCSAIKPYVDYWDEWHKIWYGNVTSTPPLLTPINGWAIPAVIPPVWQYFPEPYWGNPYSKRLVATFLNINPFEGGEGLDVIVGIGTPIIQYNSHDHVYSKTIEKLIAIHGHPAVDYFQDKRANWIESFYPCLGIPNPPVTVNNIITADLIPWHTPNANLIQAYILANVALIDTYVIKPITDISHCAELKGLVFAKGAIIEFLLREKLGLIPIVYRVNLLKNTYRISVFFYNNAYVLIFVGGRNMRLPSQNTVYFDVKGNGMTVCEIVCYYLNLLK